MNNDDYFYPWRPLKYRRKTMHLTAEQDGMYRRLIDHYMETRRPLPDNDMALARACGVTLECFNDASSILKAFFKLRDGMLWHDECEENLFEQDEFSKKRSAIAKMGAEKRWNKAAENKEENASSNTEAMLKDATQQNTTKHNKEEGKPSSRGNRLARGTRLSPDWVLPSHLLEWALANSRLTEPLIKRQADYFRDFWIAKAGENGVKLDWDGTWRNWIRKESDRNGTKTTGYNNTKPVNELRGHAALDAVQTAARSVMAAQGSQKPSNTDAVYRDTGTEFDIEGDATEV